MIRHKKHKGLKRFHRAGDYRGIRPNHGGRLNLILTVLDAATQPGQVALPGLRLHPLSGERSGYWSLRVSGNWRVTFCFEGEDVTNVDYEDYH